MQSGLMTMRRCMVFLLLALCAPTVLPQSHNREAVKWFDAGLSEKNAAKRIEAYTRATEIDPDFAEALFNLGAAYKEQKNYERAEQFLRRAANLSNDNLRVKALSELASIYNIRGNDKSAESALREAKSLSSEPKQRAVLAYELGRLLYRQGRYEQAATELKDGRSGDPAMREAFDNLLKLAEGSLQLDHWYDIAEKQKNAGNLPEAKTTLAQIIAKNDNFRDVQIKLREIETLLATEADKAVAPGSVVQTESIAPVNNVNDTEAEKVYAEGLVAVRQHDWQGAIAAFERVLQLNPNYRDVQPQLADAQLYLERDNIEAVAARYYAEGVAAMNRNELDSAWVALGKVYKINRRYRDVATLYAQVEAARRTQLVATPRWPSVALAQTSAPDTAIAVNRQAGASESPDSVQFFAGPSVESRLDSLYELARGALARGDWKEAMFDLQKIRMLRSGYRDVDQLFAGARTKLVEMAAPQDNFSLSRPTLLLIGGLAIVGVTGLVLGFLFFSPVGRARMQRWRGNDNVAALIYESLLARRPSRMKLYPALAEIYLKMNRRDESALQVYRRVLELNLPSSHRADMNAIVALNTVYEKATNGEVIVKPKSFISEVISPGSSVLLADGGFHVKEKAPARRPRKKKEITIAASAASTPAAVEADVVPDGELLMDGAFSATPAKPRKKKDAVVSDTNENGVLNGTHLTNAEQASPITTPEKKPRREKVTVVDSIHIAETMTGPVEVDAEVAQVNLHNSPAALDEVATPVPNEPAAHEEMSAA